MTCLFCNDVYILKKFVFGLKKKLNASVKMDIYCCLWINWLWTIGINKITFKQLHTFFVCLARFFRKTWQPNSWQPVMEDLATRDIPLCHSAKLSPATVMRLLRYILEDSWLASLYNLLAVQRVTGRTGSTSGMLYVKQNFAKQVYLKIVALLASLYSNQDLKWSWNLSRGRLAVLV